MSCCITAGFSCCTLAGLWQHLSVWWRRCRFTTPTLDCGCGLRSAASLLTRGYDLTDVVPDFSLALFHIQVILFYFFSILPYWSLFYLSFCMCFYIYVFVSVNICCYRGQMKIISWSLCLCLQGSEQESKGLPCKKGIVQSTVGQGYHRKIVLASQSTQNTIYRSVSTPTSPTEQVKLLM